jgi:DUF3011 family protein
MKRLTLRFPAILLGVLALTAGPASAQGRSNDDHPRRNRTITVVCESRDGRRHLCATDTLGQITLGRQLSARSRCVEGRTWGYDRSGIWVDRGCRAEFQIAGRGPSQAMARFVCESNASQRTLCHVDAPYGVNLERQISRTNCVLNRNWGTERNGVWVSNGCRAEFSLNTRNQSRGSAR